MRESTAKKMGARPIARIVSHRIFRHAQAPNGSPPRRWARSTRRKAGWGAKDVDLWEVNEAFAAVTMAAMAEFKLPHEIVNVHGGACAGASDRRLGRAHRRHAARRLAQAGRRRAWRRCASAAAKRRRWPSSCSDMPHALIIGASRGIGAEFVRQYRAEGWQVTATARGDGPRRAEVTGCDPPSRST